MKAMILAGGLSTRLYPLTKTVPKPLVPVLGEPNVAHVMRYLKSFGISEIAINVFYFAGDIRKALGDGSQWGVRLTYLDEAKLSGSAGAVRLMRAFLDSEPFVVIGCDDLTNLDLEALLAFHCERDAVATIGLVEREDVCEYGVVVLDDRGKIVGFQEKPAPGTEHSRLVNTGVYVFSQGIFERIPSGEVYDFGKQVFPKLQEDGVPFYGYEARGAYWCDIGTIAEYRRVSGDVLCGRFALQDVDPNHRDATARISPMAKITGPVWIGAGASVEAEARIAGPSVIGTGVRIETGARVEHAVIWQDAVVGEGAAVSRSIVGAGYRVAPARKLEGAIAANEP